MALVEIPDDLLLRLHTQRTEEEETALTRRLEALEARMTEMTGALQQQRDAIVALTQRINELDAGALQQQVAELTQALADRDAAAAALAEAETAEDVVQQAEIDRLTTEANEASTRVADLLAQVQASADQIATGVQGIQENTATLNTLAQPPTP